MSGSGQRPWTDGRIILPVVLLVVTTAYLVSALQISSPYADEGVGPAFFPILIALMMYVALGIALVQAIRARPRDQAATFRLGPPVKVVLLTSVYILLFAPAGYFVSTILYVYGLFYVFDFGRGGQIGRIAATILIALIGYALFELAFGVRLPKLAGVI